MAVSAGDVVIAGLAKAGYFPPVVQIDPPKARERLKKILPKCNFPLKNHLLMYLFIIDFDKDFQLNK
jgi:hypothetical protein